MLDYETSMYKEAVARLRDADTLAQSLQSLEVQSDSQMLLRILAFEVLLKCAVRLCGKTFGRTHGYAAFWSDLTSDAQNEILTVAGQRMPGHADISNLTVLFDAYEFIFKKARYYYELYEELTAEQRRWMGERWELLGASDALARVLYYPNELDCLIAGLRAFIEPRISHVRDHHG